MERQKSINLKARIIDRKNRQIEKCMALAEDITRKKWRNETITDSEKTKALAALTTAKQLCMEVPDRTIDFVILDDHIGITNLREHVHRIARALKASLNRKKEGPKKPMPMQPSFVGHQC